MNTDNDFKFDGVDFAELFDCFGISEKSRDAGGVNDANIISDWLGVNGYEDCVTPKKEIVLACRAFLEALNKNNTRYDKPLFLGLAEVSHDFYFMRYFRELLGYMWI